MKKTLFSRGLYIEGLKRLRVIGSIVFSFLLVMQFAPIISRIVSYFYFEGIESELREFGVMTVNFSDILASLPILCVFIAPVMVQNLLSVFNKRSSSDFFHALPYTRPCIFISFMASVFAWVAGICIVCSVSSLITYVALPMMFSVIFDGVFDIILTYIAVLLITTGAVSLSMALTGTTITNISVAMLILFLPRFIITIMTSWITSSAEFMVFNENSFSFFSPAINVFFDIFFGAGDISANLPADIYSIILGAAYTALAIFAFTKRKSETATRPAPDRITQSIIRIMISLVVALFALILFMEREATGFIIVSIIAVIVYFTYEIVTTHRFKNCLKALPGLGVLAGLCVLCWAVMTVVPIVASNYTPDSNDIDSVRLISSNNRYEEDAWFGREAEKLELKDKKIINVVSKALKENMENYKDHGSISPNKPVWDDPEFSITYQTVAIKEGLSTKYRRIAFTNNEYSSILDALEKNKEYRNACMEMPKPAPGSVSLDMFNYAVSVDVTDNIFNVLQKEIKEKSFEEWYSIANNYSKSYYDTYLFYYTDEYHTTYVHLPISADDFPKTFNTILETGNETRNDKLKEFEKYICDEDFINEHGVLYGNVDVTIRALDDNGMGVYYVANMSYEDSVKYFGEWQEQPYMEIFRDMIEKIKNCKDKPSANGYINISYSIEGDDYSDFDTVYLPLPADFDPAEYDLKPIS